MRVSAVIAAGGQGTRVGGDAPKQLQDLGGETLLSMAIKPFDEFARFHLSNKLSMQQSKQGPLCPRSE